MLPNSSMGKGNGKGAHRLAARHQWGASVNPHPVSLITCPHAKRSPDRSKDKQRPRCSHSLTLSIRCRQDHLCRFDDNCNSNTNNKSISSNISNILTSHR
mmetsp:Transcript_3883/g.9118  ORF Transcript_3883/g.9118 Transcript_3883/m.9118 type:complete len:100 (+) Transcript_3883:710-1009(+)